MPPARRLLPTYQHHPLIATHLLRALQQNVRAVDVVLSELEGVAEGVVHVRLGRKMEDRVDLFLSKDVRDQV